MPSLVASVWVGTAPDEVSLEGVLLADTTACDGDGLGSAFSRAAGVPALASAVREVRVLGTPTRSTHELLEGLSYAGVLKERMAVTLDEPCTAVVVFYGVATRAGQRITVGDVALRSAG